ncbi:MAG: TIR domain-containing protein [Candidatus Riflebacteria bacterium]|nr:TIR domain-containing protein [Candidatus Riflebacteria bacterium]
MTIPKLFISYSWSNTEHEEWVIKLATELRENGVDVILDKWDLKEGNDANAFMEKMVTANDIKKVILVIDEKYSEKANKRAGGVGTETQLISAEVYESVEQSKFVAVVVNKDCEGKVKLPAFYKSRIYIDLSCEDFYAKNFEQLLRWVFDKPLHIKPELGNKPAFLDENPPISLGTSVAFRRLIDAIKNSRPHKNGALIEYFNLFSANFAKFKLEPSNGISDFDQKVIDSIEQFIPARNELMEVFSMIAQYENSNTIASVIHNFLESLIPYTMQVEVNCFKWDCDNFKFIIQEIVILCIAICIKHERYEIVEHLLKQKYYVRLDENQSQSEMRSIGVFSNKLETLKSRNIRLNCRRMSIHADLMKERIKNSGISFEQIMQADFLIYLSDEVRAFRVGTGSDWWPETLLFKTTHSAPFEIFLRSESSEYFSKIAPLVGIKTKADLEPFVNALQNKVIRVPTWDFHGKIDLLELMNYNRLCIST